jgi:hypothetical protein
MTFALRSGLGPVSAPPVLTAKDGRNWGTHELLALNILVAPLIVFEFFGWHHLPLLAVLSPIILNSEYEPREDGGTTTLVKDEANFFGYLDSAMAAPPDASAVVDFTRFLLRLLGYNLGRRIVNCHKEIAFEMCGRGVSANVDLCVMDRSRLLDPYVLLMRENQVCRPLFLLVSVFQRLKLLSFFYLSLSLPMNSSISHDNPGPQLVTTTIAFFYEMNWIRRLSGLIELDAHKFAGIAMTGTTPTFYKILVTGTLVRAVSTGGFPP